ncbi:hypothetical protein [Spongiactinospora sp. 9N601]|uniref:hypothetical protein n=1 Tax=Spongiactinospora sp. 9N601 TaxID=3375149 RepID=UPI0037BCCCE0
MSVPGGNDGGFNAPSGDDNAGQSAEDASVSFQPPTEGGEEQASFSFSPLIEAGVPSQTIDTKEEIAAAIQRSGQDQQGVGSAQSLSGIGNLQGVAIGMSGPDDGVDPGTPIVTVYVAESSSLDAVRSTVVDAMGVRAAGDTPIKVVKSGIIDALPNRALIRPAPGGFSVGHFRITAGTIGCLATGRTAPRNQRVLCLSNNHVLANSNNAAYGDCICQPGPADGGTCPTHQIAILERFVPLRFGGPTNYVDCATGWCWPDRVRREIGYVSGGGVALFRISNQIISASLGMVVGKSGRTTQLRTGTVTGLNWSGWIDYRAAGKAWFANQVLIQGNFSQPGDSGSSIWTWNASRNPVGLLFAGGDGFTIANPMSYVASALDIYLYT